MSTSRRFPQGGTEAALLGVTVVPFFVGLVWVYLGRDFWHDEMYTLVHYVLVSFPSVLTDYSVPNNHIFFNFLCRLFLVASAQFYSVMGNFFEVAPDHNLISGLLEHPARLRTLMLLITSVTLVYLYRVCKKSFDRPTAWIALLILVTTVPFFNFTMWVRGYGLSMTLILISVYHLVSYLESEERRHAVVFIIVSALLFYTIPLNAYFLVTVGMFYGVLGVRPLLRKTQVGASAWQTFLKEGGWVVACLAIAGVVSLLLYSPIEGSLLGNKYAKSHEGSNAHVILEYFPQILSEFISSRYAMLPLVAIGCFVFVADGLRQKKTEELRQFFFWVAILIVPFLISFFRGDRPPPRAFANLCPAFAIVCAVSVRSGLSVIPRNWIRWNLAWALLVVYCYGTLGSQLLQIKPRLHAREQSQFNFRVIFWDYGPMILSPRRMLRLYEPWKDAKRIPVYTFIFHVDSMDVYLAHAGLQVHKLNYVENWRPGPDGWADTITSLPKLFTGEFEKLFPGMACRELVADPGFHHILRCGKEPL